MNRNLLSAAMTEEFWKKVREEDCYKPYRESLLEDYKKFEGKPILALRYSDFRTYYYNGSRKEYQIAYYDHREALTVTVLLSKIYPENDEYIVYIQDLLWAILDEYTWCLPAHQPNFPENNNTHIDLGAAETALALADIYTLMGDRLEPLIRSRIEAELERRIFKPFETIEPYSWWETGTSNWTAVCIGFVACTYMHIKPQKAKELIPRFEKAMKNFLSGFSAEGACLEGASYWQYGFCAFMTYADMVKIFTDGEIDHFKSERVRDIGVFSQNMFLTGRCVASFADCSRVGGLRNGIMHRLKIEYPDLIKVIGTEVCSFSRDRDIIPRLREAIWFYPVGAEETDDKFYRVVYAPSAQWLFKRTPCYGFAAKGGKNNEPHNHNDIGNFIYAKDKHQILCDIGSREYVKDYFGPKRYTFFESSSRGHSVPIIDGEYQEFGEEYCARDVSYENEIFTLDIAPAYKNLSKEEKILRAFSFTDDSFTLTDNFSFIKKREVRERIITLIKPELVEEGKIKLEDVFLTYDSSKWEYQPTVQNRDDGAFICYTMDFVPVGETLEFSITVK